MAQILIADAGSSKSDWSLLNTRTNHRENVTVAGINPALHSDDKILEILKEVKEKLGNDQPDAIFYFGAGCTESLKPKMADCLSKVWNPAKLEVDSDMIGACKALFADGSGIACILGTGSNSCLYLKGKIEDKVPSLGYILGDEGSGSALGKDLLNAVFKRRMPDDIIRKFNEVYHLDIDRVIQNVYIGEKPSSFLASFSPFLLENIANPAVRELVIGEFDNFFKKNILNYPQVERYTLGFVGSIAFNFEDILRESAKKFNLEISRIIQKPLKGLEDYYCGVISG